MVRVRDSLAIALTDLRERLRDGAFAPGSLMIAAELAQALAVSITPVREALARLVGERLIEERRGLGYFAPRLEAGELEALYRLHAIYVSASLSDAAREGPLILSDTTQEVPMFAAERSPLELRSGVESLFSTMVRESENRLLIDAHRQTADRLAAVRLHEDAVIGGLAEELEQMAAAAKLGDLGAILYVVDRYHERRISAAIRIAAKISDPNHYNHNII